MDGRCIHFIYIVFTTKQKIIMKALVYTGVEELTYREEKNPIEKNGERLKSNT